jgi:hypothetical protein
VLNDKLGEPFRRSPAALLCSLQLLKILFPHFRFGLCQALHFDAYGVLDGLLRCDRAGARNVISVAPNAHSLGRISANVYDPVFTFIFGPAFESGVAP